MAQRLPIPGQDDGQWGDILNGFLGVEHNADGTLKASGTLASKADTISTVHTTGNESVSGTKTFSASPVVPTPTLASQAANKGYIDGLVAAGAPAATTSTLGIVQLAGDLGGSGTAATAPVISDGAITNSKIANGSVSTNKLAAGAVTSNEIADATITNTDISATAAIARTKLDTATQTSLGKADTALQTAPVTSVNTHTGAVTLVQADVGLGNVDNTSDATKNSAAVTLTNKTISGASNTLSNIPESAVTSLVSDLAATEKSANKGAASGYAPLNGSSQVPIANIPTGTSSTTVAIGNDTRITGAIQGTAVPGGDLSGTYTTPTVSKVNGVGVSGTPAVGNVPVATSATAAVWGALPIGAWLPSDNNLKAANMIPETASSGVAIAVSTNYTFKIRIPQAITATNAVFYLAVNGATLSGWYAALYDSTGSLVSGTATTDQSSKFTGAVGTISLPFGTATAIAAGIYYLSLSTGTATTAPQLQRGGSNSGNLGLTTGVASATAPRWGTAANTWTGGTPPATLGTITAGSITFFSGIS
ncbi:MAG: hypothetical protein JWN38_1020 [Candidatus Saccharibacteria bacterium]|nr:hypothetical protein [Candidatus Saccharibacteria bacterium]